MLTLMRLLTYISYIDALASYPVGVVVVLFCRGDAQFVYWTEILSR